MSIKTSNFRGKTYISYKLSFSKDLFLIIVGILIIISGINELNYNLESQSIQSVKIIEVGNNGNTAPIYYQNTSEIDYIKPIMQMTLGLIILVGSIYLFFKKFELIINRNDNTIKYKKYKTNIDNIDKIVAKEEIINWRTFGKFGPTKGYQIYLIEKDKKLTPIFPMITKIEELEEIIIEIEKQEFKVIKEIENNEEYNKDNNDRKTDEEFQRIVEEEQEKEEQNYEKNKK